MIDPWDEIGRRHIGNFYIFDLFTVERRSQRTGLARPFVVLEAPDWINVIALTPDDQALFVRQYRHGSAGFTLEVPAGMVDPHESDPLDAARRELLEETGYAAASIELIGSVEPNPAFLNNRCHTYLALDVRPVQEPTPDGSEELEIILHPADRLRDLVASGAVSHSLTIAAFFHYEQWLARRPAGA